MFFTENDSFAGFTDFTGLVKAVLLFGLKYFHIWLGIEALMSLKYWFHDAGSKKITRFVLVFIIFEAILANLILVGNKNNRYGSNMMWQKIVI